MDQQIPNNGLWQLSAAYWRYYLSNYETALRNKNKDLDDLDRMVWNELSKSIHARDEPHVNADEYRLVVSWKLKRGKHRPSLMKNARDLDDGTVIEASKNAFSSLEGDHTIPFNHLTNLRGCGPGTASALLAIADSAYPFMSDELLLVTVGRLSYTMPSYNAMLSLVHQKVKVLSAEEKRVWTARDVERVAFAYRNGVKPPSDDDLRTHCVTHEDAKLEHDSEKDNLEENREAPVTNCETQLDTDAKHPASRSKRQFRGSDPQHDDNAAKPTSLPATAKEPSKVGRGRGKSNRGAALRAGAQENANQSSTQTSTGMDVKKDDTPKKVTRGKGRPQVPMEQGPTDTGNVVNDDLSKAKAPVNRTSASRKTSSASPVSNKGETDRKTSNSRSNQGKQLASKKKTETKEDPKVNGAKVNPTSRKRGRPRKVVEEPSKGEEDKKEALAGAVDVPVSGDAKAQDDNNQAATQSNVTGQIPGNMKPANPTLRRSKRAKPS